VLAGSLGLEVTLLHWGVLNKGLLLVMTHLLARDQSTSSRSAKCNGFLGTSSDGSELLDGLLGDAADLLGPLGALGVGGVATGLILALLLIDSLALDNIILNIMLLLLGPALRLVLSSTDLVSDLVTVLDERSTADLNSLGDGLGLVLDEAALPEVFITFFLLLRLIVGHVGCVTSLVVGVVTLDNLVILNLLNHLNLVNTTFATILRSSSNISKADTTLRLASYWDWKIAAGLTGCGCGMFGMMVMMSMFSTMVSIEGESVEQ